MELETVAIESLALDPQNARTHSKRNLDAIAASLNKFGQRKPIVVHNGVVIAGNGTLEAAKSLGWKEIAVSVCPADWDTDTAKAYALADNRSSELAEWDDAILATQLLDLDEMGWDIEDIGFSQKDLPDLNPVDEDEIPEPPAEPVSKLGQIYQLGRHRLMCGDSTDSVTVERLMNGEKADMVFTDPPYGVSYQSNMRTQSEKFAVIKNDERIITDWIEPALSVSQGFVFIWTTWKVLATWLEVTKPIGEMTNMIVWDKGGGGIGDLQGTYLTDHEIALVFNRGAKLTGKRLGSVWGLNKDGASTYVHPTQKPVSLGTQAITTTTHRDDSVLDLFGGSGSTLIAAEQTNRVCYMMELDPKYCDVIIKRWENLTGLKAELIS
jgi:DNA modification methylase